MRVTKWNDHTFWTRSRECLHLHKNAITTLDDIRSTSLNLFHERVILNSFPSVF